MTTKKTTIKKQKTIEERVSSLEARVLKCEKTLKFYATILLKLAGVKNGK